MRIGPISTSKLSAVESPALPPCKLMQTDSSIESLKCGQKNKVIRYLQKTYVYIKEKLIDLYEWLLSWFVTAEEEDDVGYYKQAGASKKEIAYKMIRKGKGTENVIRLGLKYADLAQISIPKAKDRIDFPDMLDKMMDEEGIDGIRTDKLSGAYHLWTCKLRTEAQIKYKLQGREDLSKFIHFVIQKAMEKRSSLHEFARRALLRVETMMIQAIVADQFAEDIVDMSAKDLHQKVADAKGKTFLDQFNGARCRGRIAQLEALLGHHFDLHAINRQAVDDKQEEYIQLLKMIPPERGAPLADVYPFEFQILIEDLFILMEAIKTDLNEALAKPIEERIIRPLIEIIQPLPTITFTKRI